MGGIASRLVAAALAFLVAMILGNALGVSAYGAYSLAIALLGALSLLGAYGIDLLAPRELRDDHDGLTVWNRPFLRWTVRIGLIASLGATIIGIAFLWFNPIGWPMPALAIALPLVLAVPAASALRILRGHFQSLGRVDLGLFFEHVGWNLGLVLFLALLAGFWPDHLLKLLGGAHAVAILLSASVGLLVLRFTLRSFSARQSPMPRKGWNESARWFLGMNAAGYFYGFGDLLLVGSIGTIGDAGIYSIALRLSLLMTMIVHPVQMALTPVVAASWRQQDFAQIRTAYNRTRLHILMLLAPLALVLALGGRWILPLFGSGFSGALATLQIMVLAQVGLAAFGPAISTLSMCHEEKFTAILTASVAVFIILGAYALYPIFGVRGVAFGRLGGMLILGIVALLRCHQIGLLSVKGGCD